jgi:hypothetical protein
MPDEGCKAITLSSLSTCLYDSGMNCRFSMTKCIKHHYSLAFIELMVSALEGKKISLTQARRIFVTASSDGRPFGYTTIKCLFTVFLHLFLTSNRK